MVFRIGGITFLLYAEDRNIFEAARAGDIGGDVVDEILSESLSDCVSSNHLDGEQNEEDAVVRPLLTEPTAEKRNSTEFIFTSRIIAVGDSSFGDNRSSRLSSRSSVSRSVGKRASSSFDMYVG